MTNLTSIERFIDGLPKAELHMHLEGSLEPEQMFELAKRNRVNLPFRSVDEIRQAYNFSNLQDFLDIYYQGTNVLLNEQDFFELTLAYCRRAHLDNCRHVEVFFDPQAHTGRGVAFDTVVNGIANGLDAARDEFGMTSKLIMCFLRHLSEEDALETLALADAYLDRIDGVGLDSSEVGHPPRKFTQAFQRARDMPLRLVAHAGEEGPASYVWEAIKALHVHRIDHGNNALDDDQLVDWLVQHQMTLTVCPLSNLKLRVVDSLDKHPLKVMLNRGLRATVNSDDPAYFGGYIGENYRAVTSALGLSTSDLKVVAENSFLAGC